MESSVHRTSQGEQGTWAELMRIERRVMLAIVGVQVLILAVTGIVLFLYFLRSLPGSFDRLSLDFDIPVGMVARNLHRQATNALLLAGCVHAAWCALARLLHRGPQDHGRRFMETVALVCLMVFFIGCFLPWEWMATWSLKYAWCEEPTCIEGRYDARSFLVAGRLVRATTSARTFVQHLVLIPFTAFLLGGLLHRGRRRV